MTTNKLFLLDGHALVYRAHFAFINRPLVNSKGINTSAIMGFVRTLWDLITSQKPSHIAVAFDPKGKTFRNDIYPEYKANRDAQPEDIQIALPYIKNIIEAFNIPIIMVDNFEADDVIGTIAKQAEIQNFEVYMVTPDKDFAQLVSDSIFIYKPGSRGGEAEIIGKQQVLEKWDIQNPLQVIDILGLMGDSVDNIPGVPGIGPKTATALLKEYHTVENLLKNTSQLKGKQKEKVETNSDQAILSKTLATINTNSPISFDAKAYKIDPPNREMLTKLFKELEFRTIAKQILGEPNTEQVGSLFDKNTLSVLPETASIYTIAKKNISNTNHTYHLLDTSEKRENLISKLHSANKFSFDTETTNVDPNIAELVGLVFSIKKTEAFYIPIPSDYDIAKSICTEFATIFNNPEKELIGQNIKYDALIMKWYGIEIKCNYADTMIAHYLIEPDLRHKLDYLSETYLDYKMIPITDIIGKRGKNQITMREVPIEKAKDYACEDADITLQLKEVLWQSMNENKIVDIYQNIEAPLIKVLTNMEYEGVKIDDIFLKKYSIELGDYIDKLATSIYDKAGSQFNLQSPRQIGVVLFDNLKIPYRWRKTSTGQYSTDFNKLTELAPNYEIVQQILDHRMYAKLKNTYVDSLPLLINAKSGRIHSNFNQARAATGRLSSDNPNLQNIPIRNKAGKKIREAFVPRDSDHILLAADYSQIELRLIAEISNDKAMLDSFIHGNDIHKATAAKIYNKPYDKVSDEERRAAKTVNFSITYGAGATNLSRQLGINRKEATQLIESYFEQFSGLKYYMDTTIEFARENGYVQTLLGRKRQLRDINSRNGLTRSNAERMAINTPIQGTAADMIKLAMINISRAFDEKNIISKMIMQVHDELVFDVVKKELEIVKEIVKFEMKNAIPNLQVPIIVEMDTGNNWLEAH